MIVFDLIPTGFTNDAFSASVKASPCKELHLKIAKRERLMKKMMEVLEEFEALESRYQERSRSDAMTSWKVFPQNCSPEALPSSFSSHHNHHLEEHVLNFSRPSKEIQASSIDSSSTSLTSYSDYHGKFQPPISLPLESNISLKPKPVLSPLKLSENRACQNSSQYAHYRSHSPDIKKKTDHYSQLELYSSGLPKKKLSDGTLASACSAKEIDRRTENGFNQMKSGDSMFVSIKSTRDGFAEKSIANKDSAEQNGKSAIHNRKQSLKTIKSWSAKQQGKEIKRKNKQHKKEHRKSMPVQQELVQRYTLDSDNQVSTNQRSVTFQSNPNFDEVDALSKCPLLSCSEMSCSESELAKLNSVKKKQNCFNEYPQRTQLTHFLSSSRLASASSLDTASVSSIEFLLEESHLRPKLIRNLKKQSV